MHRKYVAMQAIVDRKEKNYGYELLYRNSRENCYPCEISAETATKDLISTLTVDFNTEHLTRGKLAFVNFPRQVLLSEAVTLLDPNAYMIEILEDVVIDEEIADRIHELKKKGYQFAVDDYTGEQNIQLILDDISVIKIDIPLTSAEVQQQIIDEYGTTKRILAEKIETKAEFQEALEMGYHLFQGFYFARPTIIMKDSLDFNQGAVMSLLRETREDEVDFDKIDNIINADAGLTYRLLARGNTAQFAGKVKFTNATQVVVRMGIEELQKWATLLLMQESASKDQEEKMELALQRGIFLQQIALAIDSDLDRQERYFLYLTGMFSVFPEETRCEIFQRLAYEPSPQREEFTERLVQFLYSHELGEYDKVEQFLQEYGLSDSQLLSAYIVAVTDAHTALKTF